MSHTRRAFLSSSLLAAAGLGLRAQAAGDELVVGYIYVGSRTDFGYNQSHARAAREVAKLPGVRLVEQEKVPESEASAIAMKAMIVQEGARVLYPTSWGYYDPYVLKLAQEHPEVVFRHCGAAWREGHPANVGSYLGRMHEGQYLSGYVAGAMAAGTQLGFVASKRYPSVLRNVNAFALGAQAANPDARMRVVFTGSWSDPVREAESVNALVDQGAEVVGCSVDSARTVVETALRRGVYSCGYNASIAELGGESYLTAAVSTWDQINLRTVRQVQAGERPGNFFSGGLAEGLVDRDAYGMSVPPAVAQQADEVRASMIARERKIWVGPLRDSEGQTVVPDGEEIRRDDPRLFKMNWFVQGVEA